MTPAFSYQAFPADGGLRHVAFSFYAHGQIHYRTDKILPTGFVVVLFSFGGGHRVGGDPEPERNALFLDGWVQGNWTRPLFHTPLAGTHVLGLALPPETLMRLTGRPTLELTNRVAPADDVLPVGLCAVMRAMRYEASDENAHAGLHRYVEGAARHPVAPWIGDLAARIMATKGQVDLAAEYARLPISDRTARDRFKDAIGVTPRHASRIRRLLALLEAVDPSASDQWTSLAHEAGFFDQAHFNHEFRKLTGLSPTQYLESRRRAWQRLWSRV